MTMGSVRCHRLRFLLSCFLSFTAGHMTNYSVIFYFQEVIGSELLSGIGFGLCFGPPIILGWFAGVTCDRISPFRIIAWATLAFVLSNLMFAWIAALPPFEGRELAVLVCAFFAGVGWSFVSPARLTALRAVTSMSELPRASLIFNVLVMLGFGLGPLVISLVRLDFEWQHVLITSASLFLLSLMLLWKIPALPEEQNRESDQRSLPQRTVFGDIREGMRALRSSRIIQQLMLCAFFGFLLMGPIQVIIPKMASSVWNVQGLNKGALLGVLAPAFIAGGAICLWASRRFLPGRLIFGSLGIAAVSFLFIGFQETAFWVPVLLALIGIFGGMGQSQIVTLIQVMIEGQYRGRISSVYTMSSQVVPAFSGLMAGLLVTAFGPYQSLRIWGLLLLIGVVLFFMTMTELRQLKLAGLGSAKPEAQA